MNTLLKIIFLLGIILVFWGLMIDNNKNNVVYRYVNDPSKPSEKPTTEQENFSEDSVETVETVPLKSVLHQMFNDVTPWIGNVDS